MTTRDTNGNVTEKVVEPWGEPQEKFLAAPDRFGEKYITNKRYHAFISGIGAGKTVALILRAAKNVHHWNPGEPGMIVAPTTTAIKTIILPEIQRLGFFEYAGWEYYGPQSKKPGIAIPNGSHIFFGSANNDREIERLRGPSLAWFGGDEWAIVSPKAWDIMVGRLRRGEYRNAFVATTPKGYNHVYDRFYPESDAYQARVARGGSDDVNLVYGVNSTDNPHNAEDYAEITNEYDGSHYKQEVEGLFVTFDGLVYPWFSPETHAVPPEQLPETKQWRPGTLFGVDWGFRNPAVILALKQTRAGDWYVVEEFYQSRMSTEELAEVGHGMIDRWGPGTFYCDSAEPARIQEFVNSGLDARKAVKDVQGGIATVTANRDRLYVSSACQALINEFGVYQYDESKDGEVPVKANDHAQDALRYALASEADSGNNVGAIPDKSDRRTV